jgi:hypothetical protein
MKCDPGDLLAEAAAYLNKISVSVLTRCKKALPLGITGIFPDFNISKSSNN